MDGESGGRLCEPGRPNRCTSCRLFHDTVLEYAAPIWSPIISETSWKKLQVVQNHALRIITGCLTKSSETHLHRETKVLPIKPHATMITKQYLASCFSSTHPGNKHLALPAPPRNLKPSMQIHEILVKEKFDSGLNRKYAIKEIHTDTVTHVLANYPPNKVLNSAPPEINKAEQTLSRHTRTALARLRSGYCRSLNHYMNSIDEEIQDVCPKCSQSPHNTPHLFACPADPTDLTPSDLWTRPIEAATFLKLPGMVAAPEPPDDWG